jgi:hypothetical protein
MKFMKNNNYIIFIFFCLICGAILAIYDNYLMDQEIKDLIKIEFSKPINIKKRFVRRCRDGRGWILNDSFLPATIIRSFDRKFWLDENWGKVDSLIKKANSDTLKCVLINGNVIYLEVDNPANDNGW